MAEQLCDLKELKVNKKKHPDIYRVFLNYGEVWLLKN